MIEIRYVQFGDKEFWFGLDRHLPDNEFEKKVQDKQGYILLEENYKVKNNNYELKGRNIR